MYYTHTNNYEHYNEAKEEKEQSSNYILSTLWYTYYITYNIFHNKIK